MQIIVGGDSNTQIDDVIRRDRLSNFIQENDLLAASLIDSHEESTFSDQELNKLIIRIFAAISLI